MATHEKVSGRNAARAVLEARLDDVVRIAYGAEDRQWLGPYLREAAARRLPYAELDDAGLESLAESIHHEGVVVITRPRRVLDGHALFERLASSDRFACIALDGVTNPHNIGAILRTAAFLGIDAVCIHGDAHRAPLTPAAVRIAEGAAEHIDIARIPDLDAFLAALRREGVAVFSADPRGEQDAFDVRWPARTVLVFGSEARGLSPAVQDEIDLTISIRGTDAVESINVSVAAGIVMAAWLRSRG